jgi:hypothetical protein
MILNIFLLFYTDLLTLPMFYVNWRNFANLFTISVDETVSSIMHSGIRTKTPLEKEYYS